MSATVTDAGPFEKLVEFTVSEAEIESAKSAAARRLSRDLKIRGFRPGKAPRPIVEATVGSERLRAEAIDDVLPGRVSAVLDELEIEPAVSPSLESMDDGDDGVDVRVRVTLWPSLEEVPEHEGRTVEVGSLEVTEEEITEQIDRIRSQFADLTDSDGPAGTGDYVTIDVSATRDGEEVAEASAAQLVYEVGSGRFVEGIDEHLEGAEKGATVTFDGVLPEGFGELAGSEVTFRVVVTDIRSPVLPELTDEWVAEITEFASVAELEVNLETRMAEMKRRSLARRFQEEALDQLVDQVDIELPDALVRAEMDEVLHRFVHRLEEQGITLDDYFSVSGVDREQFVDDLRRQGERSVRTRLLLEAVAERSGLRVSDEELATVVDGIAAQSDDPEAVRRALRDGAGEKSVVGDILRNRALGVILAGATPVDEDGNPVDLEIEALDEDGDEDDGLEGGDAARRPVAAGIPVDEEGPADVDAVVEAGVEADVETAAEAAVEPAFEAVVEEPPGAGAGGGTGVVNAGAEAGGSEEE